MKKKFPVVPFWDFLGIEIAEMRPGYGKLTMRTEERLTNPYGYTHGGVLSTLADSAAAVAIAGITDADGKRFVTIEMKINYLAPVADGIIEAEARVLREGRVVPAEVDIYNENKLVAKAIATYIILDEKKE
ncbi:MAG: PaaI family thioesterase [Deltaproteobacteria bacterium]